MRRFSVPFFLAIIACVFVPERLTGATFNIANGDVAGLRSAIITCNSNTQNDVINLAAGGTYVLTTVDPSNPSAMTGLPTILRDGTGGNPSHTLTINGNGAVIQRSAAAGTPEFRLLNVSSEVSPSALVTISGLTLEGGRLSGPTTLDDGGAIKTFGNVVLNDCTIRNNTVQTYGGGLANRNGTVSLNRCAIYNNSTISTGGRGGGVINWFPSNRDSVMHLTNCTFTGNTAAKGASLNNWDNADAAAVVQVVSCTFKGGELYNEGRRSDTKITLFNTLLADSPLTNLPGPITPGQIISGNYNLSTDNGGNFLNNVADRINADPKLDPAGLSFNGGPTPTFALTVGSEAIDAGNTVFLATDQRGFPRPVNNPSVPNVSDGADIGAFEAAADPLQSGTSLVVNTLDDHDDGVCGGLDCTLREALQRANAVAPVNAITFAPGLTGVITLSGGELTALGSVSITGPGARSLAISGNNATRILRVLGGGTTISGLTFRDGYAFQGVETSSVGGALYVETSLTLNDCTLSSNRVLGGAGLPLTGHEGGWARGGAIFNGQSLTLNRCTFSGNGAFGGSGGSPIDDGVLRTGGRGGRGLGGAVFNDINGVLIISQCTFSGNSAIGGNGANGAPAGGAGGAGGVAVAGVFNQGAMTVYGSTITNNSGSGGAGGQGRGAQQDGIPGKGVGGVRAEAGTSTIGSSLIAGNTRNQSGGPDVDGIFASIGFNLVGIGDFSSGFNQNGDQVGTTAAPINAMLGPLQNNGGPTDTIALLNNGPAIDRGKRFGTSDQRGLERTRDLPEFSNAVGGDGTDIGAFELNAGVPVFSIVSRKTHGASGVFNLSLPTTGATGIECRAPGPGMSHQLILTFPQPVTVGGLSLVSSDSQASGNYTVDGQVVTLNLSAVANAQRLGITLNNVTMGAIQGSVPISLGLLLGDSTRNGIVASSDISLAKSLSGQPVSGANFASDVTANGGSINSSDITIVKAQAGRQLPASSGAPLESSKEK